MSERAIRRWFQFTISGLLVVTAATGGIIAIFRSNDWPLLLAGVLMAACYGLIAVVAIKKFMSMRVRLRDPEISMTPIRPMTEADKLRIRISGYPTRTAAAAQKLIDEGFTDIAWVDEIGEDYLTVRADVGINLANPTDFEWVRDHIIDELKRLGIHAQFELIRVPEPD